MLCHMQRARHSLDATAARPGLAGGSLHCMYAAGLGSHRSIDRSVGLGRLTGRA